VDADAGTVNDHEESRETETMLVLYQRI